MFYKIFKNNKIFVIVLISLLTLLFNPNFTSAKNDEQELFLIAQKAFEDGFYDVAMRYIEQLQNEYPQTDKRIQSNILLGQCYFFKSQYLKAYEIFQDLLQYSEFKDVTLYWLGETYLKGSDYKQAEKQYKQLIEVFPNSAYAPQAYYSLGWSYFEQNEYAKAKETFSKLVKNYPHHQLSEDAYFKLGETEYNLKNYEKTIELCKKYILQYPESQRHAEAYFYIAESYYYLGDFLQAITYYAKSAEISYDNNLILMCKVSMGWSYLKLEKYKLSKQYFEEALELSEEKNILSEDVLLGIANLYSSMQEQEKALEAYTKLIEKFPKSTKISEAYLGKANIYFSLEKYSEAIKTYKEIIEKFSKDPNLAELTEKSYFGLAWSYLKSGDIDSSIKAFQLIKDNATSRVVKISALTQIGDAYQDIGQLEKAIEVYDQILKDYQDSPYTDYVQYRQGIALLKQDEIEAATLSFQSLRANFPDSKYLNDVKYYLAIGYFKKGDYRATIEQIQDFISSSSKDNEFLPESYYVLALSYFNLDKFNEAIKIFQKIIKNFPEQSAIIKNSEISIAKCLYKINDEKEAIKKFQIIISKYPKSETAQEALIWLGDYYLEASDFDKAISYYIQFEDNFPGSDKLAVVYFELGQAYKAKEEYDQAINTLKKINQNSNKEVYAKARLAIADIFSKEFSSESAMEVYKSIIASSPEFKREAYTKIAKVYKKNKNYKLAIENYKKAIESSSEYSEIKKSELQFYIGDTYELLNQDEKAIDEYMKIPYLYPNDVKWLVKSYLHVARIFENNENWEKATRIYNKIIEYDTDEIKFAQERIEWIHENILSQTEY